MDSEIYRTRGHLQEILFRWFQRVLQFLDNIQVGLGIGNLSQVGNFQPSKNLPLDHSGESGMVRIESKGFYWR
ncbi:MAG: hypothetical protein DRP64_17160 [Verrucomicrobia bacterium]|nr:MAG: hypothetical protein DRP64_17160 [Verrucomicrobiota bacterium]